MATARYQSEHIRYASSDQCTWRVLAYGRATEHQRAENDAGLHVTWLDLAILKNDPVIRAVVVMAGAAEIRADNTRNQLQQTTPD